MRVPLTLPEMGTGRITFSLWYVRVGERVWQGDRVAEVLIPGATYEVQAPADGVLQEQAVFPGDCLFPGQILGWIDAGPQAATPSPLVPARPASY